MLVHRAGARVQFSHSAVSERLTATGASAGVDVGLLEVSSCACACRSLPRCSTHTSTQKASLATRAMPRQATFFSQGVRCLPCHPAVYDNQCQ